MVVFMAVPFVLARARKPESGMVRRRASGLDEDWNRWAIWNRTGNFPIFSQLLPSFLSRQAGGRMVFDWPTVQAAFNACWGDISIIWVVGKMKMEFFWFRIALSP